jgi:hypothetical protein
MIDWLWTRTSSIATWWTFLILLGIFVFFAQVLFAPRVATYLPAQTFDGRAKGWWPSEAEGILKQFKPDRLDAYQQQESTLDLVFPIIYTLLFAVGIVAAGRTTSLPHWLILAPYIACLADYLENTTYIAMIKAFRLTEKVPYPLAVIGSVASRLKWGFSAISAIVLTVAVIMRLWQALSGPQHP